MSSCSSESAEEPPDPEPTTTTVPAGQVAGLDACLGLTGPELATVLGEDPGEGRPDRPVEPIDPENPPGMQFSECRWPADDPELVLGLLTPTVGESPLDHLEALQESDSSFGENTQIVTAGREGVEIAALVAADGNVLEATAVVNQVLVYLEPLIPIAQNSPEFQALVGLLVVIARRLDPPETPPTTVAGGGEAEAPATTAAG